MGGFQAVIGPPRRDFQEHPKKKSSFRLVGGRDDELQKNYSQNNNNKNSSNTFFPAKTKAINFHEVQKKHTPQTHNNNNNKQSTKLKWRLKQKAQLIW